MPPNTFEELKEREREARRELILSAALTLFAEHDFLSVTVREIAREAGVSPGTIYRYYESLDDLFLDVFFVGAREITDMIETECKKEGGCSITRFCEIYIDYLNTNLSYFQMMGHFMLGGKLSEEATEKLNPIMRTLMDRVEAIVADGKPTKQTRFLSHALFSALNGIMISFARYPGRESDEIYRHTRRLAGIVGDCFENAKG
jgi:AcrR family transcriptional regulator